ncbi:MULTISPECIES: hypothetical protein [unclassified Rhizobium]|uniref:hypothetical protein n=1 Tax=unclassified Rhizobium TaxID=2613769 RepID=UPI001A999CC5|nr:MULTISPECIES: hypothetical protein [unclassified Rhizobium]MBX5174461.1 hypothetical protein [Rhizobium sp. NZLR1b]MBX5193645.1 hypothetical protein [Rhizobium sp. NZLR3b]MBX5204182.1 hypothetical protein [Rhizobium sp. NZLR1]MBX5212294.1 hypothetical protein [Rhizobium sp. NZLR11]QSZ25249.1 hypothetical protein J3O30_32165 [Rhizobium sp. NZLR1]
MHLTDTKVAHQHTGGRIDFVGDDGDAVAVHVADGGYLDEGTAVQRARAILVQLTEFGTRGGGRSLNAYDAASNGNFDDIQPLIGTPH